MYHSAHGVSAAWRLGKWETVEHFLEQPCENDFEVQVAKYDRIDRYIYIYVYIHNHPFDL
jgi:hypothetical protein